MSDLLDETKDNIKMAGLLLLVMLVSSFLLIGYAYDYIKEYILHPQSDM